MPPASALQMHGSQEGGSIDEDTLSSILKTALGVAELTVTGLFRAIDQEEKGRITFGEWPGAGTSPVQGGGRTRSPRARRCWDLAGLSAGLGPWGGAAGRDRATPARGDSFLLSLLSAQSRPPRSLGVGT